MRVSVRPLMMKHPANQPSSRSTREAESVPFGVRMPRASGERDRVAIRPGEESSRAGYSSAAAGGYEFRNET
jgi:hypothetical protein